MKSLVCTVAVLAVVGFAPTKVAAAPAKKVNHYAQVVLRVEGMI